MTARMRRRHGCGKGGAQPLFLHRFGRFWRLWQAVVAIRMEHFAGTDVFRAATVEENNTMFGWALTFLIVALIAAVFGFGGIAGFAVEIAQLIFYVAIILLVISVVMGLIRGRTPTVP
jgi:uncharacterized membrane protein YtjA (UPF0391 family)